MTDKRMDPRLEFFIKFIIVTIVRSLQAAIVLFMFIVTSPFWVIILTILAFIMIDRYL